MERAGLGGLQPRAQTAVLALALLVIGLGVWRFWPSAPAPEEPFDEASAPAVARESAGRSAAGEPSAEATVVVHVVGAVMHPGVYDLPGGSRVVDAVEAAGGALGNAALSSLNLARVLADGEQVYVCTAEEVVAGGAPSVPSGASAGSGGASALVDLNTATAEELDALPGVGPSTAAKIVSDREANGPFATPEDLMRVPGIGAKKFDALKDLVTCG